MPLGAFSGVAPLTVDLDPYLTTNVLDSFTETLGIRYHHVNSIVVVGDAVVAVNNGADRHPMAAPCTCSSYLPWERK